jgi:hypothetical protein
MIARLAIAVALVGLAVTIALVLRARRRVDAPTQSRSWAAPAQLDRADFDRPEAPWLVAVFSSTTCESCGKVVQQAGVLASRDVAVHAVSEQARPDLHRRYAIEAVPILVIADAVGVVRASFVGPHTATDLWARLAEVRAPGSTPFAPS